MKPQPQEHLNMQNNNDSLGQRFIRNKNQIYLAANLLCLAIIFIPLAMTGLISGMKNTEPTRVPLADFNPAEYNRSWLNLPGGEYAADQLHAYYFRDDLVRLSMPYVLPGATDEPALVIAEVSDDNILKRFAGKTTPDGNVTATLQERMTLLGLKHGELQGWCRSLDVVGRRFKVRPDAVSVTVGMGPDSPWLCTGGVLAGLAALVGAVWVCYRALRSPRPSPEPPQK